MSIKNFPSPRQNANNISIFLFISLILHIGLILLFEFKRKIVEPSYSSVPVEIVDIPQKPIAKPKGEIVELPPEIKSKQEKPSKSDAKRFADRTMRADRETSPKQIPLPRIEQKNGTQTETARNEELAAIESSNLEQLSKEKDKESDAILKENRERLPAPSAEENKGMESKKKITTKELFPSEQRLAELDTEYQRGVEGVEEGKTLSLNTSEYRYFSYLNGIKRKVELVWNYPDAAARAGQQGKLELTFTIKKDGGLENVTLVKSSGYPMLDDEAISAIKVAAPYNKFPKGFNLERITIAATFEYIIEPYFFKQIR